MDSALIEARDTKQGHWGGGECWLQHLRLL